MNHLAAFSLVEIIYGIIRDVSDTCKACCQAAVTPEYLTLPLGLIKQTRLELIGYLLVRVMGYGYGLGLWVRVMGYGLGVMG